MLRIVEKNKRDEYKLARSSLGCRHWVDFKDAGFISPSIRLTTEDAVNGLRYNYTKGKDPEPEKIDPGTFVADIPKQVKKFKNTDTKDAGSGSYRSTGSGSDFVRSRQKT
ncbi:uncharacterized protein EAF02_007831 [Botrytis sinoallii]|uniref:uncharacterized protein n=1 Tax=Botrytis sinoallii TaxID=1463999 RepID=UPI0019018135|nr:uncharacterized protein EAF02_007831 [Botrytis sinoallii]KAF7879661.1 hypothetical protein EAF02_007831 [Botrytis sinoallii]